MKMRILFSRITKTCRTKVISKHEYFHPLSAPRKWKQTTTACCNMRHFRIIGWKYFSFYVHYRFFFFMTILTAVITGVVIGMTLSSMLDHIQINNKTTQFLFGEMMTVEALDTETTLVLRVDDSEAARQVARAYVLSHTGVKKSAAEKISYTALDGKESLKEYLVTRAIDSPQHYVYLYGFGVDLASTNDTLKVQALFRPLHSDKYLSSSERSLARAYMALLRYYTNKLDASIEIYDEPLAMDLTPWMKGGLEPALLIQFLLVITVSHITMVPSHENGLVRHMQSHAMNFSPARYWFTLAFFDLIHYWMLAILMATVSFAILMILHFHSEIQFLDLLAVPIMMMIYGIGCLPQAYLFSLGPHPTLNSMAMAITNIVFGEATIVAKLLYGEAYDLALNFMVLSPQYNMAHAFVKIRKVFLYNSECSFFKSKKLCASKVLHKCCNKCGVLQRCFVRQSYASNILTEVIGTLSGAALFMFILLLWEYKLIQIVWNSITNFNANVDLTRSGDTLMVGAQKEISKVLVKEKEIKLRNKPPDYKVDTFGENLLAVQLSRVESNVYIVKNVYLGVAKGEAVALSGLKRHGRLVLCELLAGLIADHYGNVWAISKYRQKYSPHKYCSQIALCGERDPLPNWMTVYDGLKMIATLRGVPRQFVNEEIMDYIEALDLTDQADILICRLQPNELRRLNFATAVVGAPPILILDECTAYQNYSVIRAMFSILSILKKRGHAIVLSAFSMESHMPISNRLAIIRDGEIYELDHVETLLERYSETGYTVVVHLKDEVDIHRLFSPHFHHFVVNDTSDVLVNMQIMDHGLSWSAIFAKMEQLQASNYQVYEYIVCAKPIEYIYNSIISEEMGFTPSTSNAKSWLRKIFGFKPPLEPSAETLKRLFKYPKRYDLTSLQALPWNVIFQR